jgi:hypothetical protein
MLRTTIITADFITIYVHVMCAPLLIIKYSKKALQYYSEIACKNLLINSAHTARSSDYHRRDPSSPIEGNSITTSIKTIQFLFVFSK